MKPIVKIAIAVLGVTLCATGIQSTLKHCGRNPERNEKHAMARPHDGKQHGKADKKDFHFRADHHKAPQAKANNRPAHKPTAKGHQSPNHRTQKAHTPKMNFNR